MNIIKIKQFLVVVASLCLSAWASADTYTYDNLNRLTSVVYSSGQQITYSYDAAGNRASMTGVALVAPVCTLTASPALISPGSSSTLTANCTPAAAVYAWTGGSCVGTSGAICTATPAATTSYGVTGTNGAGAGAPASAMVTVTVNSTGTLITRYRLYSDYTKEHLYTTDFNEYSVLPGRGWLAEGAIYKLFQGAGSLAGVDAVQYYRLYNPLSYQHHWTTDANEYNVLGTRGWSKEGVDGYILPTAVSGSVPLYRLYLNAFGGLHLWTTDANEKNVLSTSNGWVDEGVAGWVIPLP